jgi:hypothetical protein
LGTQLQFQFVIGFFETFLVDGKFKKAFQQVTIARFWHFLQRLWHFLFFLSNEGMLSAIAIAAESAPKLPNFVKIYPKTISLRNFEIQPKIEILIKINK